MAKRLPQNPLLTEVLQAASNAKTKAEKIKILQEHKTEALQGILIWNFDDTAKSALPPGDVPYTPSEAPAGSNYHTRLVGEYRKFYHFIQGASDINQTQRENIFITMLESLHKDEAELLCLTKDGNLSKKYRITLNTVKEAYPEIVWGNRG
jgi:hypothetical protein